MKYSKFFKFLEKKDHLINKLDSLTPEQKQEVIAFFNKHPSYESEIDWNKRELNYEDFEEIMNKERISASQLKNFVKEGKHYLLLYKSKNLLAYQPLTWLGSRYIASDDVAPYIEGKWCTAYQKSIEYWSNYSFSQKESFLYLCTPTTKWALEIQLDYSYHAWNNLDRHVSLEEFFTDISKEVPNIKEILEKLIPQAVVNHSLAVDSREIDEIDNAILEKNRKLAREAQIKAFPKSFPRQVRKKGYYQWDGDLNLTNLQDLGLYDKETGFFDERVSKFKVTGNVDFKRCTAKQMYLPQYIEGTFNCSPSTNLVSIVIPDGITSIDSNAFSNCYSLTSVTIPNSVTSIGDYAFAGCASLKSKSLSIPDSVTEIGQSAFSNCKSLTRITIPNGVTEIRKNTFWECRSLTKVIIPDSVTSIGEEAFEGCTRLKTISIPDNVNYIDGGAFINCKALTSITIPEGVPSIKWSTFRGCLSLTEIKIPNNVTSIGIYAFYNCSSLTDITIPDSVTSIGKYAFRNCSSLTEITIPDSVTSIGEGAFSDCSSLISINIPDSVASIGINAFYGCSSLSEITIPDSVTSIGDWAFSYSKSLKAVYIDKEKDSLDIRKADIPPQTKIYWKGEF